MKIINILQRLLKEQGGEGSDPNNPDVYPDQDEWGMDDAWSWDEWITYYGALVKKGGETFAKKTFLKYWEVVEEGTGVIGDDGMDPNWFKEKAMWNETEDRPYTRQEFEESLKSKINSDSPKENTGLTKDDLIVAATLWGEARGEKKEGMQAVANVIRNRADSDKKTPKEIVLQKSQFSVWDKTKPDAELKRINTEYKKNPKTDDSKMWDAAKEITLKFVKNKGEDITKGAKFYHAASIKPPWKMEKYTETARIGNHIFYKLKA